MTIDCIHRRTGIGLCAGLASAALLLAAGASQASPTTYEFTIDHLRYVPLAPPFTPTDVSGVRGGFIGEDLDHDGQLLLGELSLFYFGQRGTENMLQFLPSVVTGQHPNCVPGPDPSRCELRSVLAQFSFDLAAGTLQAEGGIGWLDHSYYQFRFGDAIHMGDNTVDIAYTWTPDTTVTVRPVPEPASVLTLTAGLLGLGAARRLRLA
jgi:hypothetical protein